MNTEKVEKNTESEGHDFIVCYFIVREMWLPELDRSCLYDSLYSTARMALEKHLRHKNQVDLNKQTKIINLNLCAIGCN